MSFLKDIREELKLEAAVTRRYLESVPFDKPDFRPHEKSETLIALATHVAEIIAWWKEVIENAELDFINFKQKEIKSSKELLTYFDSLLEVSLKSLKLANVKDLNAEWSMLNGEDIHFTLPKKQVLRVFCLNHLIHHRAQLGVYLRLLDVPVPAAYGPSADDYDVILVERFN